VVHDSGMRRSTLGDWGVVDVHAVVGAVAEET
jgi:hypothetical protein